MYVTQLLAKEVMVRVMKVLQSFTSTASGNPMIPELATLKSRDEPIVSVLVQKVVVLKSIGIVKANSAFKIRM